MSVKSLRILPPLAIGRLGSAADPLDNFTTEVDPQHPLDFRQIVPATTLVVNDKTGAIDKSFVPTSVEFKTGGKIRPVAPFLEVWVETSDDKLVPLTEGLLQSDFKPSSLKWQVVVANRKVERRTGNANDSVVADTKVFSDHAVHRLEGHCKNFVKTTDAIHLGDVRFIQPTKAFPEIRLRFTPAAGLIYGPDVVDDKKIPGESKIIPPQRRVYDASKGWYLFEIPADIEAGEGGRKKGPRFWNETLPAELFAIVPPAPPWLHGNIAISRGYFDDACDGIVKVTVDTNDGRTLNAAARITAGPPMLVPDARFVRSLADDLEQALSGPTVDANEPIAVTRARAEEIVRRAYETARFLNIEFMNGENYQGRPALSFDTMPAEEAFDTQRLMRPVMAAGSVDTLGVMALHQQVFAALRGGAAPWFVRLLRRPEEVVDFTDDGRRKMPALMCGADGSYLALTHRQIATIERVAETAPFEDLSSKTPTQPPLTPRNLTAQLEYVAAGNPASSRPSAAIANCCPGLEVDFRAVWRRLFKGIVLREYDNLVVEADSSHAALAGCRLLRIDGVETMGTMIGPSPADPAEQVTLATDVNPNALAPLEWSNALAYVLAKYKGKKVACDFTSAESWYEQQPWTGKDFQTVQLEVRDFFEPGTAFISTALAQPGELTQGLCSPWQNDFRECSCYYWASARPDFVNVAPGPDGDSTGDNWLQKVRTGTYVPDDYVDERLLSYDELFLGWEHWLRFQIGGRDVEAGEHS